MSILQKAGEILVDSGYADYVLPEAIFDETIRWHEANLDDLQEDIEPFTDTLIGRQQADAIEDYIINNETKLWVDAHDPDNVKQLESKHQDRLAMIKYCLENL